MSRSRRSRIPVPWLRRQGEVDTRFQASALPDPRRHDDLRRLTAEDIGAERISGPGHRGRAGASAAAQVEVEDFLGR